MRANRAAQFLDTLTNPVKKQVMPDGVVAKPLREAIDRMFENVFSTVAFQTAVICAYAEAIQIAYGGIQHSTHALLDDYIDQVNQLLRPKTITDLKYLLQAFEGELSVEPEVKLTLGGPTFRQVVLPGELQPAEWPKYRYMLLELWKPTTPELQTVIDADRTQARAAVAQSLYRRRLAAYCEENRVDAATLTAAVKSDILTRSKDMHEGFLAAVVGKKVPLDRKMFEGNNQREAAPSVTSTDGDEVEVG